MKEKFKLSLFLILLAMTTINVSAAPTPADKITEKEKRFSWEGQIPKINPDFDWDFVDKFGNPYVSPGPAFFTTLYNKGSKNSDISGEAIDLFIAPKDTTLNIINEVFASLIETPKATGLIDNTAIRTAMDFSALKDNEVAIIVNNTLMKEGLANSRAINKIGSDPSRFQIYIQLKALIPDTNAILGELITFEAPVMFSVGVIGKTNP